MCPRATHPAPPPLYYASYSEWEGPLHKPESHMYSGLPPFGEPYPVIAQVRGDAAIRLLLRHGADPNAAAADGSTPLHMTALHGGIRATLTLLEAGADPNARDADGQTPLHAVARMYRVIDEDCDECEPQSLSAAIAVYLLEHGADPTIKDNSGRTPLDIARASNRTHVARILQKRLGM